MWNCKHCLGNFNFIKTSDKANHSRWCDKNPKLVEYKNNQTLVDSVRNSKDVKYGLKQQYIVHCNKCSTEFKVIERTKYFPKKEKYFCSRSCANGRTVSNEAKLKIGKGVLTHIKLYGVNGGNPVKPLLEQKCEFCKNIFYSKRKKNYCGIKCANKFIRSQRPALINYRADCAFRFNLKDFPKEFDFALIEKYGWYSAANRGNNLTGISRDHIVSVKYGFDNNIDPHIISHPANCRLVTHTENSSKNQKSLLTLEELLIKIKEWDKKYNSP
jgi:hypothetical protein